MTFSFNQELVEQIRQDKIHQDLHSIKDFLRWIYSIFNHADIFYGHGQEHAWDEAQKLVFAGLYLPFDLPNDLYDAHLTLSEKNRLVDLLTARLEQRVPVAYLTNSAWFCGLEFYVDQRVLIPRSPIGELIQSGFTGLLRYEPKRILDMCTGSGCIAIACADRFPNAEIDAVDLSLDALSVTEINIEKHQMEERVFPIQSNLFAQIPHEKYDLIVTNPPYVDRENIADMPAEFHHEPMLALEAGEDGLVLVKQILAQASDYLNDNAMLVCEVGNSMVHLVNQFSNVPFTWLKFNHGGEGVFAISKEQLIAHRHEFI